MNQDDYMLQHILDKGEPGDDEPVECPYCEGEGEVLTVETRNVTHDMAIDAGDSRLEGQEVAWTYRDQCQVCEGTGMITYKQYMEIEKELKDEDTEEGSSESAEDSGPF